MGMWLRGWLTVGTAIALLGGLLWLVAEGNVGMPALLRSVATGFLVWVVCGLIWLGVEYGQRYEDEREHRRWSSRAWQREPRTL
jgi:hypothetical protein